MPLLKVLILAIVQGLAELLPVSSSAHGCCGGKADAPGPVVACDDAGARDAAHRHDVCRDRLLLEPVETRVLLVVGCLWPLRRFARSGRARSLPSSAIRSSRSSKRQRSKGAPKAEIELLFARLDLVAYALFAAGLIILWAGMKERSTEKKATLAYERAASRSGDNVTFAQAGWMGAVQGALPAFPRLLALRCNDFDGPAHRSNTRARRALQLCARRHPDASGRLRRNCCACCMPRMKPRRLAHRSTCTALSSPRSLAWCLSFFAGLAALRWLSSWLENGRWYLFGIYCVLASTVVFYLHHIGY